MTATEELSKISDLIDKKLKEYNVIYYSNCKTTYDKLALLLVIVESEDMVKDFMDEGKNEV